MGYRNHRRPRRGRVRRCALFCAVLAFAACAKRAPARPPLEHDAYVWQRHWSADLNEAVRLAPAAIGTLRVLARQRAGALRAPVEVAVDTAALVRSGREVVAVFRIDGGAPLDDAGQGVSLDEIARVARTWREHGVRVRGVEIDHDCATASLPAYARWLWRGRAMLGGLTLSITALPTWVASPFLPGLVDAVDDVVVQLHTVAAPVLFEPGQARAWAEAWSRATRRDFRVALPTYRASLIDGTSLAAEPAQEAGFLAELTARPIQGLLGIAWFRLGHAADPDAWSAATLAAVVGGAPLGPRILASLVDTGEGALDVVLENHGNVAGETPATLAFSGQIDILDGVHGYAVRDSLLVARTRPWLQPGETAVVGFVRGKGIEVGLP